MLVIKQLTVAIDFHSMKKQNSQIECEQKMTEFKFSGWAILNLINLVSAMLLPKTTSQTTS